MALIPTRVSVKKCSARARSRCNAATSAGASLQLFARDLVNWVSCVEFDGFRARVPQLGTSPESNVRDAEDGGNPLHGQICAIFAVSG
jgi:hypothetical protein